MEPDNNTIHNFLKHPESSRLLNIIMGSLTPSVAAAATATAALVAASVAAASQIPMTGVPSGPPHLPLMDEGPNIPSSHLPLTTSAASMAPEYSIFDLTSMTVAEVLHKVSKLLNKSKPPRDSLANNIFFGGGQTQDQSI
jgi:hypothetical protein